MCQHFSERTQIVTKLSLPIQMNFHFCFFFFHHLPSALIYAPVLPFWTGNHWINLSADGDDDHTKMFRIFHPQLLPYFPLKLTIFYGQWIRLTTVRHFQGENISPKALSCSSGALIFCLIKHFLWRENSQLFRPKVKWIDIELKFKLDPN